jgi:hypothetical protein
MRVLVLESQPGAAADAVVQLTGAGHELVSCEPEDAHTPCRGLSSSAACPLDHHVDVAVLVQELGSRSLPSGAICAARDRIPVVEVDGAGVAARTPTTGWTAVHGPDLLAGCDRAAHDGSAHVSALTDRLLALGVVTAAEVGDVDGAVAFAIERGGGRLRLTIRLADAMSHRAGEIRRAATQALREFDRHTPVIDVAVRTR